MPFYGTAMSDKKTLEELKRTLRIQICEWCPLGDAKFQPWRPCSVKNCDKAIDKKPNTSGRRSVSKEEENEKDTVVFMAAYDIHKIERHFFRIRRKKKKK